MPLCEYVVKESTPQNPSLERCNAPAVPKSRFCLRHAQAVLDNPAEEVRQNTLAPKRPKSN